MRSLFESWRSVAARVRESDAVALFLDFDGTLAKVCARPEEVKLDPETRRVLLRLARKERLRVWVISGRRRADVRALVGVPGVRYLGLHGWEGRNGGGRGHGTVSAKSRQALRRLRAALRECVATIDGIRIEDKRFTFAIHYRGAPDASVTAARAVLVRLVDSFGGDLHITEGDLVWEVLPHELGSKGAAVRRELRAFGPTALPVYAGNDGTDEPAFAALCQGVTIRVGRERRSHARFRVGSPASLRRFLERLEAEFK